MKYIRTKDGIYELIWDVIEKNGKNFIIQKYDGAIYEEEIVAQADTIEKLCDEFVVVSYSTNKVMYQTKDYNYFWGIAKKDYINHFTIHNEYYGALDTDKGLIYIAKMNEKGELELL